MPKDLRYQSYAVAALLAIGCGSANEQPAAHKEGVVLATVGGIPITIEEFETFSSLIPEGMKKGTTALEKNRQVLNSLIDKHLMLAEATALPLAEDPKFQSELLFFTKNRLLDFYTKREVTDKITVTDEEMQEHYEATNRDRALRYSGIMLESPEEAQEIIDQVAAGGDFMELAKGRSLHDDTATQGGDVGGYRLKDKTHPAIQPIFALAVGELSEPIEMNFKGKPHFAVFQVTDEMPLPIEASELKIREEIFGRKRAARYTALLDSLKTAYQPELQSDHIRWLNEHSQTADGDLYELSAEHKTLPVCTHRDGHVNLDDFMKLMREMRAGRPELTDYDRVVYLLETVMVPAFVFAAEATAQGLHEHPALLARVNDKRDNMLISALRERYVDEHIGASEEEARAFFDANPEKFISPLTTEVVEALVPSDTLARRLKTELTAGADPKMLAREYTNREGADHHDGQLTLNTYTKAYYLGIYDLAAGLEVGQIGGPVQVEGGYSVFVVIDRYQRKHPYDATSKRRAEAYVKIDKSRRGYVRYVKGLRDKHPVAVFEDVIADALSEPN